MQEWQKRGQKEGKKRAEIAKGIISKRENEGRKRAIATSHETCKNAKKKRAERGQS